MVQDFLTLINLEENNAQFKNFKEVKMDILRNNFLSF
jgi:hypothetical protein